MDEKAKIVQKQKIRACHRSSATKLLNRVKGNEAVDKHWIKQSIQAMREKVNTLKGLDHQIIELIGGLEEGVEALIKEIEESDDVHKELNHIVLRMEEVLSKTDSPPSLNQMSVQETSPPTAAMP